MYMDNVQLVDKNFNYIDNSTIFLLDNSTYTKYDKKVWSSFAVKNPTDIFVELIFAIKLILLNR